MGIDGGIANGAYEVKAFGEGNVNASAGVTKNLSESKIYEINLPIESHHEVIWLDVMMYMVATVNGFQCMELKESIN